MHYVMTPYARPVEPFVWWDKAFNEKELDWLQNKARSSTQQARVGGHEGLTNKDVRRSQVTWLGNTPETKWIFEKLAHVASELNAQFYNFDLTGFGEELQLTNYDQSEQGMYGWHQDYGGTGASRKLSLVVQLTGPEEYDGGNLEIMTGTNPIVVRKQRGLIAAFPSYIVHQVTPVTRGSRQSLVAWVSGPRFK